MTKKIIVAKSTYNALIETNPNNLIFTTDYGTLKYYAQGTKTIITNRANYYKTVDAGWLGIFYYYYTTGTVEHNLGYIPYFCGYFYLNSTNVCQCPYAFGSGGFFFYHSVFADDTYLYFVSHFNSTIAPTGTVDSDFAYRIFKNSLGL